MSLLEDAYANGQHDALTTFKLATPGLMPNTTPKPPSPLALADKMEKSTPPDNSLADVFNTQEQAAVRVAPPAKAFDHKSAGEVCTTCRQPKHYGPCKRLPKSRPAGDPQKSADFNMGMHGDDPSGDDNPATSPNYTSATSSISSLARAQEGRPADEQAASNFADLFRHGGITALSDDALPSRMTAWSGKTAMSPSTDPYSRSEQRGSVNPYEEQREVSLAPGGSGEGPEQAIARAFGQVDSVADSTSIEGASAPSGGPPVLAG